MRMENLFFENVCFLLVRKNLQLIFMTVVAYKGKKVLLKGLFFNEPRSPFGVGKSVC